MAMRQTWRSWFWNVTALLVFTSMGLMVTAVAVDQFRSYHRWASALLFGLSALWLWVGAARSLRIGVAVTDRGLVIRGPFLSRTIPWAEVEKIEFADAGMTTPVVCRNRGGKQERVMLTVLGGYGVSRRHPTPAERAVADLNAFLDRWRAARRARS
jgi:hypothetical protein